MIARGGELRWLDVELCLEGGAWVRRYRDAAGVFVRQRISRDALRDLIAPLRAVLDRGWGEELLRELTERKLVEHGERLFRVLFSEEADWRPVFTHAFKNPNANPTRYPIRVRIREQLVAGETPILDALPWRITAWMGHMLASSPGWRFELARFDAPDAPRLTLHLPTSIVAIAPSAEGLDRAHAASFQRVMEEARGDSATNPKAAQDLPVMETQPSGASGTASVDCASQLGHIAFFSMEMRA